MFNQLKYLHTQRFLKNFPARISKYTSRRNLFVNPGTEIKAQSSILILKYYLTLIYLFYALLLLLFWGMQCISFRLNKTTFLSFMFITPGKPRRTKSSDLAKKASPYPQFHTDYLFHLHGASLQLRTTIRSAVMEH